MAVTIVKNGKLDGQVGTAKSPAGEMPGLAISFPAVQPPTTINLTEDDIAEEFANVYGDRLRFDHDI